MLAWSGKAAKRLRADAVGKSIRISILSIPRRCTEVGDQPGIIASPRLNRPFASLSVWQRLKSVATVNKGSRSA
jgi:hypothetical protein